MTDGAAATDDMPALLLDAAAAARLLGISRSTLYCLDERGGIPRGVHLGRMRRWRREELLAWVRAGCPPRVRWEQLTTVTEGGYSRSP